MAVNSNAGPFEFRRMSLLDFDLAACSGVNAVDMIRLLNGRLGDLQEDLGDSGSAGDVMYGDVRYAWRMLPGVAVEQGECRLRHAGICEMFHVKHLRS